MCVRPVRVGDLGFCMVGRQRALLVVEKQVVLRRSVSDAAARARHARVNVRATHARVVLAHRAAGTELLRDVGLFRSRPRVYASTTVVATGAVAPFPCNRACCPFGASLTLHPRLSTLRSASSRESQVCPRARPTVQPPTCGRARVFHSVWRPYVPALCRRSVLTFGSSLHVVDPLDAHVL